MCSWKLQRSRASFSTKAGKAVERVPKIGERKRPLRTEMGEGAGRQAGRWDECLGQKHIEHYWFLVFLFFFYDLSRGISDLTHGFSDAVGNLFQGA